MLLHTATFVLPTVLRISLAHTITTLPVSYESISTSLHFHASPSISTIKDPALVKIEHGDPRNTSAYPVWASEPTISASASPNASRCSPLQIPCGSIGCYDSNTEKCCNENNICNITHNCVKVQLHNGTIAAGCCAGDTLACGDMCFDAAAFKCCAAPGSAHGPCPKGQDCCGNMCCDEGAICTSGFKGPICWQRHNKNNIEKTDSSPTLPSYAPIGVEVDTALPEKKGGGGHGSGGHSSGGSGGHNGVRPGGGAPGGHKSIGARVGAPMSLQNFVWIVLPVIAGTPWK